ncbi:MAG: hypothetical protein ACLR78_05550 [Roseburia sp.]
MLLHLLLLLHIFTGMPLTSTLSSTAITRQRRPTDELGFYEIETDPG